MRQLIDTEFKDVTSYPQQASADSGAVVIDHFYGPVNRIQRITFDDFLTLFPPTQGVQLTPSYVNAYRAFQNGLNTIEVVRLQGKANYFAAKLEGEAFTPLRIATFDNDDAPAIVGLISPGNLPLAQSSTKKYQITVDIVTENTAIEGVPDVTIALESYELQDSKKVNVSTVESFTGGVQQGCQIDGFNYDIEVVLAGAQYLQAVFDYDKVADLKAGNHVIEYTDEAPSKISTDDICAAYNKYFRSIESSVCTILIDPGTENADQASVLTSLAEYRQNCTTMIGYPVSEPFTKDEIMEYKTKIAGGIFSAFYAMREQVTIASRKYVTNGMGTVAGDYAKVAISESVNQLPSAKTWGSISTTLTDSLDFDDVLALHAKGINSCYNSVDGPRLFGLRSLYVRETSYFSKFNVGRVCARILQYAFNVAIDAIHTGNTDARKALTQNLLAADVKRLVAQGALRAQSKVQCDDANNKDIDTNGGEYLIIDYTCWFVKLIERVKIRITATDSSVGADISAA